MTRGLSEAGVHAAGIVAERLRGEGIQVFYSSPYRRAVQTLEGLAAACGKPIVLREDLRETDFSGPLRSRNFMEPLRRMYDDFSLAFPECESNAASQERAVACLLEIVREHRGERIAIGTHGNVMALMMGYFDPTYGFDFLMQTSKPDIYRLEFDGARLVEMVRMWEA